MQITLSIHQLQTLLGDAAELASQKTLTEMGQLTKFISRAEAYRMYGRKQVDRWIREGLITQYKDGTNTSRTRINRHQIETVAKASNRHAWLQNQES